MKYYPPSNHIYYEDSDVAINKLHIKDLEVITEVEKELLVEAYQQLHNELSNHN